MITECKRWEARGSSELYIFRSAVMKKSHRMCPSDKEIVILVSLTVTDATEHNSGNKCHNKPAELGTRY